MTGENHVESARRLVDRLFTSIEAGDLVTAESCYPEDAVIWHNTDSIGWTREENTANKHRMVQRLSDIRYDDRRLDKFDGDFVHRHVVRTTRKDGARVALPAALICRVRDSWITRLDEYFDSAHVAEFRKMFP